MKVHQAAIIAAFALVGGCSGDGALPTSPITPTPAPTAPVPTVPIQGQIAIAAMDPSAGATVVVSDCDPSIPPNFSVVKARPKHFTGPCALGFRAVVNVEVEEELPVARVIVEFRDQTGHRCAYADSYDTSLPAHTQKEVAFGELMLTENTPGAALTFCALPVTTTEVVVSVSSGNRVLTRQLPFTYTFVKG
jgi:hypothetical protein